MPKGLLNSAVSYFRSRGDSGERSRGNCERAYELRVNAAVRRRTLTLPRRACVIGWDANSGLRNLPRIISRTSARIMPPRARNDSEGNRNFLPSSDKCAGADAGAGDVQLG